MILLLLAACDTPTEPEVWTFEGDVTASSISFGHVDPAATVTCEVAEPGGPFNPIPVLGVTPATGPVCRHYRVESVPSDAGAVTYPLYIAGAPIGGRYRVRIE